jgi:uncharacterized tellurite resistance protein B-like protein
LDYKSPDDFVLLILVHMATVDGSLHPTEHDAIVANVQELFPMMNDFGARYRQIEKDVKRGGKDLSEQIIRDHMDTLNSLTGVQKMKLYRVLFDVLNADGRVNEEETRVLRLLKSALIS